MISKLLISSPDSCCSAHYIQCKQLPQFQMIMFSSSRLTVFLYRLPGPEDEGYRQTEAGQISTTIWIYGPGTQLHNSLPDTRPAWFCLQHNRSCAIPTPTSECLCS